MASAIQRLNDGVADSIVGRYFKIRERGSTFTTELRAGVVTFLATAYILAVNANILSDTGGTCGVKDCTGPMKGKFACVFPDVADPGYSACLSDLKKSLITVTCAVSIIATFLTGVGANMPLALAPGMGLNAYFTYTVVGFRGTGNVRYQEACAAIFIEGFIFMVLGATGVRGRLIRLVPRNIMLATSAGIGLFLAHIGLQQNEGLGVIAFEPATLVTLGGCPLKDRVKMYTIADPDSVCAGFNTTGKVNLPAPSVNHSCTTNKMRSSTLWLGVAGGLLMVVLLARRVKGAVMVGILFVTFISWIHTKSNKATYFGPHSEIAGGEARLKYFKKVVDTPDASSTAGKLDFGAFNKAELWVALVTMLYVDFLDTTGTLYSMANFMSNTIPGFINDETKEFPGMLMAFTIDGLAISICGLLGTSPTTAYIESATGIKEGGRTGMTAVMIAFCFFVALFFTPILASIPPYATGPALILVGALMMENIKNIEWHNPIKAVPAFLTIAVMPLTYSIAYGVIAGICSAMFLEGVTWVLDKATGGPVIEEGPVVKHVDDN